jgi:hypothetical protein
VPRSILFGLDIAAILILTFALYFPRHRRRDMIVAYLGVNVGVLAVTNALASDDVGLGLGLGLFGVLSIIRLRSAELDQEEVAYYFAALALGLVAGFEVSPDWLAPALMVTILAALFIGDHPRLFGGYRVQVVQLDQAVTDEGELRDRLTELFSAKIHRVAVRRVDLVRDTTTVEVRYEVGVGPAAEN